MTERLHTDLATADRRPRRTTAPCKAPLRDRLKKE